MKTFSTVQAARLARISPGTLRRWFAAGRVVPSCSSVTADGRTRGRWTKEDLVRLLSYKEQFYRSIERRERERKIEACPRCGGLFDKYGLGAHLKSCQQTTARQRYLRKLSYDDTYSSMKMVRSSDLSPEAHRRALKRKLAGIRGKLTVVKREITEIQAQEKPTTDNPGLFGQQPSSHPGLRALQNRQRQLEHVVKLLEGERRGVEV